MDMGSSSMDMDMATSTGSFMPMSTSDANMSMTMDMDQMNMVFFISTTTPLWTKSFTPSTTGQYAGVCMFLIAFATVSRMLVALRVNFYTIRAAARRRRNQGLLAEPKGAIDHETMTYRPWRAKEAIMLGVMDFVIVGNAGSDDDERWIFPIGAGCQLIQSLRRALVEGRKAPA
ncbi:hypothetical protein FDECE_5863 [Fusarium decemcellulare]|nr:hypothetical protein FDECE_5863 [Fusarium decemcellulare]